MESDMDIDSDSDFQEDNRKGSGGLKGKWTFSKRADTKKSEFGDHVLRIMEEFPLLSSWKDFKYWTGFIQGENKLTRISVSAPNFPSAFKATVQGDRDSVKIFSSFQDEIDKLVSSTKGLLLNLLTEIKLNIHKYHENGTSQSNSDGNRDFSISANNPEFFLAIFNELDLIGVDEVESATKDFKELTVKYVDQLKRKHVIKFTIPPKYPQAPFKVCVDLPPSSNCIAWPSKLSDAFDRFKSEVDRYVSFWSVVDELDNQARVIDPIQPKRGDIHRRILLNQNVVVNLVFNPLCPKAIPEIKFSGPEKSISELDAMIDEHCKEWSEDRSILENLEDILQQDFLLKSDIDDDDNRDRSSEDIESLCVICYAFEFEGNVPGTTCECGSIYHDKCLSDLLVNDCSVKAKRFCVDCPACGMELKVSKTHKVTW